LLYNLLKIPARIAIRIYCRRIKINNPHILKSKGPLLIACNHPNSFLDAIIISTLFDRPVYSLARGDVFNTKFKRYFLRQLNMFPVYRTSEGVENLEHNYTTFEACHRIFRKNGIVLIFSEGSCFNEWHLRALKKGTARLAISSWEHGIPLKVLPAGINYHSFISFGKNMILNFGNTFNENDLPERKGHGKSIYDFNHELRARLQPLVLEIKKTEKHLRREIFGFTIIQSKKLVLNIPAWIGYILHAPLFLPVRSYVRKIASHNDHYDSIMTGVLFAAYPVYLVMISMIVFLLTGSWYSFLLLIIAPFTAWCYVQIKSQFLENN